MLSSQRSINQKTRFLDNTSERIFRWTSQVWPPFKPLHSKDWLNLLERLWRALLMKFCWLRLVYIFFRQSDRSRVYVSCRQWISIRHQQQLETESEEKALRVKSFLCLSYFFVSYIQFGCEVNEMVAFDRLKVPKRARLVSLYVHFRTRRTAREFQIFLTKRYSPGSIPPGQNMSRRRYGIFLINRMKLIVPSSTECLGRGACIWFGQGNVRYDDDNHVKGSAIWSICMWGWQSLVNKFRCVGSSSKIDRQYYLKSSWNQKATVSCSVLAQSSDRTEQAKRLWCISQTLRK